MNKILCVSETLPYECEINLIKMGFSLIKIPKCSYLEKPVSAHPDMFMATVGDKIFFDSRVKELFTFIGGSDFNKFVECEREVGENEFLTYPQNISFNCVNVGNKLLCNTRYTNKKILEYAQDCGIEILTVKQGYTKCSTCVVSDDAIITEDDSIALCAQQNGIDVLKVQKGHIELCGYDYGFIGGCSGLIEKNLLAFAGNVFLHPDFEKIFDFCYRHSVGIVNLGTQKLYDVGSIIRIV